MGRATIFAVECKSRNLISIHALRGEGDNRRPLLFRLLPKFQSTPSVGRATLVGRLEKVEKDAFQSTPSVGRATLDFGELPKAAIISIHALRGEGDNRRPRLFRLLPKFQSTPSVGRATLGIPYTTYINYISIHALRGEGDSRSISLSQATILFQSTPSVGRATCLAAGLYRRDRISIHALRGEGDAGPAPCKACWNISIHALRGEGDLTRRGAGKNGADFNPRPPWGGRPRRALRGNRDKRFQSTPSVGRATRNLRPPESADAFQSTPSVGRATAGQSVVFRIPAISIHALRGEGDGILTVSPLFGLYFNPRPPWGGRLARQKRSDNRLQNFNPRPPWGGRHRRRKDRSGQKQFQSTPSVGRATPAEHRIFKFQLISIHALRGEGDFPDAETVGTG